MRYVTLNKIVKDAIIDIGEQTEHLYPRFLHWAFDALKDYSFDDSNELKTVLIPMSQIKTIELPIDCSNWVKIGLVINGRVRTLTTNNNIALNQVFDDCGNEEMKPSVQQDTALYYANGYVFYNYNGHNVLSHGNCGISGNYRFDVERGRIVFGPEVPTTDIYLEYISNGVNPNGESSVNEFVAKTIKLYILWMRKENSDKYSLGIKERARSLYYNEHRVMQQRINSFEPKEFIESVRKGYLDRISAHGYIGDKSISDKIKEDCGCEEEICEDVFNLTATPPTDPPEEPPVQLPRRPILRTRVDEDGDKIYWGVSEEEELTTESQIKSLESQFGEDRFIEKTLDATGGKYIYFSYLQAYGEGVFLFNTFPTTFIKTTITITNEVGDDVDYFIYRSLNKQNGSSLTVKIT